MKNISSNMNETFLYSVVFNNPHEAFSYITDTLLKEKRVFGQSLVFKVGDDYNKDIDIFNNIWQDKYGYKNNKRMPWGDWLIDCVFPRYLYKENGEDLMKLIQDKRFSDTPSFFKKTTCHSHIGRLARPRDSMKDTNYIGFLDYTIDRWKRGSHKSMPHFYFDVESPEWMFAELFCNPNQIKSGRTATSCTSNFAFRWDSINNRMVFFQILKHSQYSHIFGDIYGCAEFVKAFCKEVGLNANQALCHIFAISISLDDTKKAIEYLEPYK